MNRYLAARGGHWGAQLYKETSTATTELEEESHSSDWQPWELLANGGKAAAMLDAVSKNQASCPRAVMIDF